jgi:hypothetical protein
MSRRARPLRNWFTAQSRALRSTKETQEWIAKQASGAANHPLRQTLGVLADPAALEFCNVAVEVDAAMLDLPAGHLAIMEDQEVCQMMGDWVMHLVANRRKRQMWLSSSWLTLQAKLLSPDAGKRAAAVEQMRKQAAALEEAKKQRSSFWQGVVRRSFLQLPPQLQLTYILEQEGWEATEAAQAFVRQRLSTMGQSKVCEDMFCVMRRKELRQSNKIMTEKSMWAEVINQNVVNEVHRFDPCCGRRRWCHTVSWALCRRRPSSQV